MSTSNIIEALMPDFIAPGYAPKIPPSLYLRRLDVSGDRFYFRGGDEGQDFKAYLSVTSFCSKVLPKGKGLEEFWKRNGLDSDRLANESALYGTFMHEKIGQYLQGQAISFEALELELLGYCQENGVTILHKTWFKKINHDLLAFHQFAQDVDLEVISIEYPIFSDEMGLGGSIDLVAMINIEEKGYWGEVYKSNGKNNKKGDPKQTTKVFRVPAIIDFKSGRKGFYESHELQLHCYKQAWNEHFGNVVKVERVYNWSPKEWRTTPDYNLKDQTESLQANNLDALLKVAQNSGFMDITKKVNVISGNLEFGKYDTEHLQRMSIEEQIKTRINEQNKAEQEF